MKNYLKILFAALAGFMLGGCALTNSKDYDTAGNVTKTSWSFTNPFTIYAEKSEDTIQVASSSSWGAKVNPAENLYVIGKSDDVMVSVPSTAGKETVEAAADIVKQSKGTLSATVNSSGITATNNTEPDSDDTQ